MVDHVGPLDDPFPAKPEGINWKTYHRLKEVDEGLRRRWTLGVIYLLERASRGSLGEQNVSSTGKADHFNQIKHHRGSVPGFKLGACPCDAG